jgi:hypothetical protein
MRYISGKEEFGKAGQLQAARSTGGGFFQSVRDAPIAWAMGLFFAALILSASIWATVYSVNEEKNKSNDDFFRADDDINETWDTTVNKPHIIYILADDLGWNSMVSWWGVLTQ